MQYAKLEDYSIALCMIRRIFLFGFGDPKMFSLQVSREFCGPQAWRLLEQIFFIQLTNGETCAF